MRRFGIVLHGLSAIIRACCTLLRLAQALPKIKKGGHRTVATVQNDDIKRLLVIRKCQVYRRRCV